MTTAELINHKLSSGVGSDLIIEMFNFSFVLLEGLQLYTLSYYVSWCVEIVFLSCIILMKFLFIDAVFVLMFINFLNQNFFILWIKI